MKRTRQSEHIVLVDGLYMVQSAYFCAGFEVENGKVTQCAPILRKRFAFWMMKAIRVSD